jgi:serine/threonine-protein kinase
MQLTAGDRLGPYEIVAQIGAGGMGVVYRARDSRVGRDVAIKLSGEHFSDRFDREARAVAALNHPNICTLHDVGPDYLIMELVEGEPLQGPLPFETALNYARQIADALDAAHEKGIVHRDLKPANIRVRPDGTVKVLDFGLAKIGPGAAAAIDPANSPTLSPVATQVGMIVGTAAYMAPEQARGLIVDKRADIWAFGVVFYEMLTGRRAFDGEDVTTILAAVIQSEPRWDGVPESVRRLLESCLQKDPRKRLRDIGDVWKLLDGAQRAAVPRSRAGNIGWIAAAALAVVAAVALWAPWRTTRIPSQSPIRLDVDLGSDVALSPLDIPTFSSLIISPDGTRLVFAGSVSGATPRLFTRRLDQSSITELAGTQGASDPFFSPDGRWVAFFDRRRLAKVSVDGGAVVPLTDTGIMTGGSWGDDGNIVVGNGLPGTVGLMRVVSAGGTSTAMSTLANGEMFHITPQILPGARAVLISTVNNPPSVESSNIDVVTIADGRRKTLVRGGLSPRYLPSGHLIYTNRATLFAVPFDVNRLETRGVTVPIFDDVAFDSVASVAQFDVSREGTLVYRKNPGGASTMSKVVWVDQAGGQGLLLTKPGFYVGRPRISPDGRRVAITIRDGPNQDVWVFDTLGGGMTRITPGNGSFMNPVWTTDGRHLVFTSIGNGMFWARADRSSQAQMLVPTPRTMQIPYSFSPDSKRLVFEQIDGRPQIWSVPVDVEDGALKAGTPSQFLTTPYTDDGATVSPDGRWLAYYSNESGALEVYVRAFSSSATPKDVKVKVSNSGGGFPVWSPNRRDLLYQSNGQIMAVSYTASGDSFVADKPRVWTASIAGATGFDLSSDGKRAAVVVPVAPDVPKQEHTIVIVQNFFDELRRRAPAGR